MDMRSNQNGNGITAKQALALMDKAKELGLKKFKLADFEFEFENAYDQLLAEETRAMKQGFEAPEGNGLQGLMDSPLFSEGIN
jgi:hypothetical protein